MGYENTPLLEAIVDHDSFGANVIVPGIPGKTILVYSIFFVMGEDSLVTFKSGLLVELTGSMNMKAAGSIVLDYNRRPWFRCADGEDFVIDLTVAVSIDGRCYYTQSATDTL